MAATIEAARRAVAEGAWAEAYAHFSSLDLEGLRAEDLEIAADAMWWIGKIDESIAVRQRAYAVSLDEGAIARAAFSAWFLCQTFWMIGDSAVGAGWLKRAQRHVADLPDRVERGFVLITESDLARDASDTERARERAQLAVDLGARCGSPDLHALALQTLGRALISDGRAEEGMGLLDEAMTQVISGRLTPLFTGWIYCGVLAACMERADLRRASEWTDAAMTWCDAVSDFTPFHGICRSHRVEIASLRGEWAFAEAEAERTVREMAGLERHVAGDAYYAIGEINLRRGNLAAAEAAFMRAHEMGRDPQPGLAAVRLAQDRADVAAAGLTVALGAAGLSALQRARLLSVQVEAALATGNVGQAHAAHTSLAALAAETGSSLIEALALTALARMKVQDGDVDGVLSSALPALHLWQELRLPYDAAHTRLLLARACRLAGDHDRADLETEAARAAFERLGAFPDASALGGGRRSPDRRYGLSPRELEVLRLVAAGRTNREIAARLVISEHTVSRHLQNTFRKLQVTTRAAAAAFAFEHDLI